MRLPRRQVWNPGGTRWPSLPNQSVHHHPTDCGGGVLAYKRRRSLVRYITAGSSLPTASSSVPHPVSRWRAGDYLNWSARLQDWQRVDSYHRSSGCGDLQWVHCVYCQISQSVTAAVAAATKRGEGSLESAASAIVAPTNPAVTSVPTNGSLNPATHAAGATAYQLPLSAINVAVTTPVVAGVTTMLGTVCVVAVDTRDAHDIPIPLVGFPLYVGPPKLHDDANMYKGHPTVSLSNAADPSAQILGIVWPHQPPQRLAHRSLLLIAVCTQGQVCLADWSFSDDDTLKEAYETLTTSPPGTQYIIRTPQMGSMSLTTLASDYRVVLRLQPN